MVAQRSTLAMQTASLLPHLAMSDQATSGRDRSKNPNAIHLLVGSKP